MRRFFRTVFLLALLAALGAAAAGWWWVQHPLKLRLPPNAASLDLSIEPGMLPRQVAVAVRDAGVEVDPSLIADGHYEGEEAYNAAMQFLTRSDRPTAILAANNIMALGALQATYDLGFRCPDDI